MATTKKTESGKTAAKKPAARKPAAKKTAVETAVAIVASGADPRREHP